MKSIKQHILERLIITNNVISERLILSKNDNITNLKLIPLIKDYRNYEPGHTPGKHLFLKSYMNDGKDFIVQDGEYKGYYIWYTPYDTTRFPDQKEYIWFTIKRDKFAYIENTIVARNTEELFKYLGEEQVTNLYNFLMEKTRRR